MKINKAKKQLIIITILFFGIFGMAKSSFAATRNVTCSGNITSALQSAIDSSSDGDVVNIGAGSCSMDGVDITNKNIIVQGQGIDVTTITANSGFGSISTNASSDTTWSFRITGFTLTGTTSSSIIFTMWADSGGQHSGWRFDHLKINYPNQSGYGWNIGGIAWGLIDNCIITKGSGLLFNAFGSLTSTIEDGSSISKLQGSYLESLPLQPGSANALYIEDNSITSPNPGGIAVIDTSNIGYRFVVRHNTINNGMLYAHWTRSGDINGFWFEVYDNKLTWSGNEMYPVRFEAGTGLIYNNTISSFADMYFVLDERRGDFGEDGAPLLDCNGTHNWDGNAGDASAPGWPCLGQIGRASGVSIAQILAGTKQSSFPFYSWANGEQCSCSGNSYPCGGGTSGSCANTVNFQSESANYVKSTSHAVAGGGYGQGDVDYCSGGITQPSGCGTHVLTYTPLVYPHPLQRISGSDNTPPAAPSGLSVS